MRVVVWLNAKPVCCKGVFDALAECEGVELTYAILGKQVEDRRKISAGGRQGAAEYVNFAGLSLDDPKVLEFIRAHSGDVHFLNGYRGEIADVVIAQAPDAVKIVWAERPGPPAYKTKFPFTLFHRYFAMKYRGKVDALLPLGQEGVWQYSRYGWPSSKLYPFLYLPVMDESLPPKESEGASKPIKFIYLGRFGSGAKGIDVLLDALDAAGADGYEIDFVGGYGDYKDQTMDWIDRHPQACFAGTWPIEEACPRLSSYDVCVVPSKYEGWNVTVNEALMAGIGVICTDECVSDELVTATGAGTVVRAGDAAALKEAIRAVVADPSLVSTWAKRAFGYRDNMTSVRCAGYLLDVIEHISKTKQGVEMERPAAPWLNSDI